MKKRYYIISLIVILVGIGLGIFYLKVIRPGSANIPNDIILETAFGEEYNMGEMKKTAKIVEFMYTQCPDVCPVTTLELSKLRNKLVDEGVFGDKVEFITITVDPERDTAEVMEDYAGRFQVTSDDQGWYFLTGDEDEIARLGESLRPPFLFRDPGSGEIIHSTWMYFIDEDDNLLENFVMGEDFDIDRAYKRVMRTIN
ncbi:MAG TPA: SCO family protein [Pseudogracilibacillus sp.]|nr:SCO family protein [Pseudogracilibacillus sp.]